MTVQEVSTVFIGCKRSATHARERAHITLAHITFPCRARLALPSRSAKSPFPSFETFSVSREKVAIEAIFLIEFLLLFFFRYATLMLEPPASYFRGNLCCSADWSLATSLFNQASNILHMLKIYHGEKYVIKFRYSPTPSSKISRHPKVFPIITRPLPFSPRFIFLYLEKAFKRKPQTRNFLLL